MDSLTQIALGGAVGYAVLGKPLGRKAILWGAALGTLPDLDVLIPYGGAVEDFTYHRSFSHSLLIQPIATPFIAWFAQILHRTKAISLWHWSLMIYLTLATHALLDTCTVYGTQLLWPLTEYPFGWSNLFIIDPAYTLPLLCGMGLACVKPIPVQWRQRLNRIGLALSSLYLMWSFSAKYMIDHNMRALLQDQAAQPTAYVSTPAPLSTLLWRIVVHYETHYDVVYASVFDRPEQYQFTRYASSFKELQVLKDEPLVQRLQWFTKGLYKIAIQDDTLVMSDLRMGAECFYAFNFTVGQRASPDSPWQPGTYAQTTERPDLATLGLIWDRIFDPTVDLSPPQPCPRDFKE